MGTHSARAWGRWLPLGAVRSIDHRQFRDALGRFASGVTVVTMTAPAEPLETYGLTVNAFMSVSLDPPLVAVSIDKRARAHPTLAASERFGVSVLREDQAQLSDQFAGRPVARPEDPFEELNGFPVVKGAIAQLVLARHAALDAGDHTIFLGRVEALRSVGGEPLLYYRGNYHLLPAPAQPYR